MSFLLIFMFKLRSANLSIDSPKQKWWWWVLGHHCVCDEQLNKE